MKEDTLLFDNQRLEAENDRLRKQLQTEKKAGSSVCGLADQRAKRT